jgi:transcription elongation factor Elf1
MNDEEDFSTFACPYCGQSNTILNDEENPGRWVQDCEVCCRPILITCRRRSGHMEVDVRGENE